MYTRFLAAFCLAASCLAEFAVCVAGAASNQSGREQKPGIVTWDALFNARLKAAAAPVSTQLIKAIHVRGGRIEPLPGMHLASRGDDSSGTARTAQKTVYLLCAGPVQEGLKTLIADCGGRVLSPCAPNAYIVRATGNCIGKMVDSPYVIAAVELTPEQKTGPALVSRLAAAEPDESLDVELSYLPGTSPALLENLAAGNGARIRSRQERVRSVTLTCPAREVMKLAASDVVECVDLQVPAECSLKGSVIFCEAESARGDSRHFGSGVNVGIIDSGFETAHTAFQSQPGPDEQYPALDGPLGWNVSGNGGDSDTWDDPSGHGTHVLGIMMSRWASAYLDGVSPWIGSSSANALRAVRCGRNNGSGFLYNLDTAISRLTTTDSACHVINNSWGRSDNTGNATLARLVDAATWDHDQLWVFAAGNSGPVPGSICSPGAAKNVLAVGCLLNSCALDVASFSSRGPTADGRYKPEIYAPGAYIGSANASVLSGSRHLAGTSMAAPHVTGIAATLMDYDSDYRRKPALVKAQLIATAKRLSTIDDERAGLVSSWNAHGGSGSAQFTAYSSDGVSQGRSERWTWTLPRAYARMYVVLTWVEPPATPSAQYVVNNNLDLYVDRGADGSYEWESAGLHDNYELVVVTNAPAVRYRFKANGTSVAGAHRVALAVFATGGTVDDSYESNNDAPSAYDLSAHRGSLLSSISGGGVLNDADWYRITVPADRRRVAVTCSHSVSDGDIDMALWSAFGPVALEIAATGTDDEVIETTVSRAGTYYIEIYPYSEDPDVPYDLLWDAAPAGSMTVPELEFASFTLDDDDAGNSAGNNDGVVNPGETIEMRVSLRNRGNAAASDVSAHLNSSDPSVDAVIEPNAAFSSIPFGATRQSVNDLLFRVSEDAAHGQVLTFNLNPIVASGSRWADAFTVEVRDPSGDLDGDGMPNWWEEQHAGNPTNLNPLADPDGDTLNNWMEWVAMTLPLSSASCFRVSSIDPADPVRPVIQWRSASNRLYHVSRCSGLPGAFHTVASNLAPAPAMNTFTDNLGSVAQPVFYRIAVELPE
jgi:subtilisin family serine protease